MQRIAKKAAERVDLSPLDGKSILVTGASGFLGQHILNAISTSRASAIYAQSRTRRDDESGARWIAADFAIESDCHRMPCVDVVIHAAADAAPGKFLASPIASLRAGAQSTMALLEKVVPGGRFVFFSSSEVYADCPSAPPYTEEMIGAASPYHPRACYTQAKLFGEALTHLYRERGISTVSLRPGITYGPGTRKGDTRAWSQFFERAIKGEFALRDLGRVERTYCYIADGLEMMLNAALHGAQDVYNIAGAQHIQVVDFAAAVGRAAGVKVIVPRGAPDSAPANLRVDCARYVAEFGTPEWTPLDDGIKETLEWWKNG